VVPSPLAALEAVNALAASATALAAWRLASAWDAVDPRSTGASAPLAMALFAVAASPLLLGAGALSDATATALVACAFAQLCTRGRPLLAGVLAALALGVRASYWPLGVSFAALAWRRRRALVGLVAGTALWVVPFVAVVGARPLARLARAHLV